MSPAQSFWSAEMSAHQIAQRRAYGHRREEDTHHQPALRFDEKVREQPWRNRRVVGLAHTYHRTRRQQLRERGGGSARRRSHAPDRNADGNQTPPAITVAQIAEER